MQIDKHLITKINASLKGNDAEFFSRVWNDGELTKYHERLNNIGFSNKSRVLDAGCGMGQWLYCLSQMNALVDGLEYSQVRVDSVNTIFAQLQVNNANVRQGSIENLPYEDQSFDAIFCYGVIFITDFRQSLREFSRVLKTGGKLYVTANGLGWYLHLLFDERNKSAHYDPRQLAIDAIGRSLDYFDGNQQKRSPGQVVIPSETMIKEAQASGLRLDQYASEGEINGRASFYDRTEYMGEEFIYELTLVK
ncbi:class I SAM-dependent methyltransferase [Alteromonas flava]|uniref:class I SAM-dependent methyltransferase n=1 Tax=Alteromonas flava TaxID=2048003 RepID=UPI0013DB8B91|nr:class I SAM-dependent methyltransferase [Alteromonas flava]